MSCEHRGNDRDFDISSLVEKANQIAEKLGQRVDECFAKDPSLAQIGTLDMGMDVQGTNSLNQDYMDALLNMEHVKY